MTTPPIDISDMLAEIDCQFLLLAYLAPTEGPWDWNHPTLRQWMVANGFNNREQLLDDPRALWVVLQSLQGKVQSCQPEAEQIPLPIVVTEHWGAWVDPSVEVV